MPEEFVEQADDAPEVTDQVDEGQATEAVEEPAEEAPSYFDYTPYADQLIRAKVQGEDIEVPLSEAIAGYQRQQDYTLKTQEVSTWRQQNQFAAAIGAALEQDPAEAIGMLVQYYGLNQEPQSEEALADLDPVEREVAQLRQSVASIEQERANYALQRQIADAQAEFGDEIDPREAVQIAFSRGWTYPQAIRDAYSLIAGQRAHSNRAAELTMAQQKAAADAQRTEAKRNAQVVAGGSGGPRQGHVEAPTSAQTVAEAFQLALKGS